MHRPSHLTPEPEANVHGGDLVLSVYDRARHGTREFRAFAPIPHYPAS